MRVTIACRTVRRLLWVSTGLVVGLGLWVELCDHIIAPRWAPTWVPFLSLSYEHNLPTWYVSCLLVFVAALLLLVGAGERGAASARRFYCWLLAGLLAYISLDEFVQIHERASGWFDVGGVLYYDWVIPASVVVAVLALVFARFLLGLPARTRRRFFAAGALYVGGALLMELPLGYVAERAGSDNLGYALIDWGEETLELAGVTLFAAALLDWIAAGQAQLEIVVSGTSAGEEK